MLNIFLHLVLNCNCVKKWLCWHGWTKCSRENKKSNIFKLNKNYIIIKTIRNTIFWSKDFCSPTLPIECSSSAPVYMFMFIHSEWYQLFISIWPQFRLDFWAEQTQNLRVFDVIPALNQTRLDENQMQLLFDLLQ